MVTELPPTLARPLRATSEVSRRARLGAALLDALALLPPLVLAGAAAVVWLLARTAWGRDDPTSLDASVALAVLAAAPAAWLARVGHALVLTEATPGQHARGLRTALTRGREPGRWARAVRLALHPFAAAGWGVIALIVYLAALPVEAAIAVIATGALTLAGGIVSLAIVLVAPDARALHDRAAGTRVVRA